MPLWIKTNPLLVEVAFEQHHRLLVKTQHLRPSSETPFVECLGFGVRTQSDPVAEHEAGDL